MMRAPQVRIRQPNEATGIQANPFYRRQSEDQSEIQANGEIPKLRLSWSLAGLVSVASVSSCKVVWNEIESGFVPIVAQEATETTESQEILQVLLL
jgi:hypothetical protein